MQSLPLTEDMADVYDCRLRPWYVSAGGAPRDVLILVDATGSMDNSSNNIIAEQLTLALLSALTDDDHVNVLRFNNKIQSPIGCFNDRLVPANHVNSAAMMAAMKKYSVVNDTKIEAVLEYAVKLLQRQRHSGNHPVACQQAIVILADSIYTNATQKMKELDPEGHISERKFRWPTHSIIKPSSIRYLILTPEAGSTLLTLELRRLFLIWLHDEFGLRDNTRALGDWLGCVRDGLFANLINANAVTQHVLDILRVLERPLVMQRKRRLRSFSDMYARMEVII
ncbi:hypothetical protein EVAR_39606_1 [Eumeta japonica]|uniref:VWFA domain-containing protein n=1 Tax=Eumeta variegata TaxID=151549 RepID=A0A4C1Y3T4_EUMVA|nr:hypothetical protein EVAR_39606_1 [Eumeta japonica]